MLTEYEKGYLSAIIEGEGYLSIYRRKSKGLMIRIGVSNNSFELLEKIKKIVGGGYIIKKYNKKFKSNSYEWRANPNILRKILPQINFSIKNKEEKREKILLYLNKIKKGINQYNKKERDEVIKEIFGVIV